jgi:VanZ family protein
VRLISKFLRYWLPVVIWLTMIFIGSTELMSAEYTSRIIGPILRWIHPGISLARIEQVQFVIRKTAHVSEYAALSLLIFRALVNTTRQARFAGVGLITLLISGAFAASDEFHQSFVPSRTSSVRDVMIDIIGAIFGMTIYWSFVRKRRVPAKA